MGRTAVVRAPKPTTDVGGSDLPPDVLDSMQRPQLSLRSSDQGTGLFRTHPIAPQFQGPLERTFRPVRQDH